MSKIYLYGEVLFDHFSDGQKVLGGCAFNVAWHLAALGLNPYLITRIGNDEEGRVLQKTCEAWGLALDYIQIDDTLGTGKVIVDLANPNGPKFESLNPVAFDEIDFLPLESLQVGKADLLYFGSFALRNSKSFEALKSFRKKFSRTFVDINLRAPYYRQEVISYCLKSADSLKANDEEWALLEKNKYSFQGELFLTLGAYGAEFWKGGAKQVEISGCEVQLVNSVGAGDAFSAAILYGKLKGLSLGKSLALANKLASGICEFPGAISFEKRFYNLVLDSIL